ncbi:MAG: hypothetical protein RSC31_04330 [Anaerovoracaceae bacterium]
MKKIFSIVLIALITLSIASCGEEPQGFELNSWEKTMPNYVTREREMAIDHLGITNDEQVVVDCYNVASFRLKDYFVFKKEDGKIVKYQYEFYDDTSTFKDTVKYYNMEPIEKLFTLVDTNNRALMVVVKESQPKMNNLQDAYDKYTSKKFVDAGYKIIE